MTGSAHGDGPRSLRFEPDGGPFWRLRGAAVPTRLIADAPTAEALRGSVAADQLAALGRHEGIVPPIVALPALAEGHGSPRAVVLVTNPDENGVVLPTAVGHSIGLGTRALVLGWPAAALAPHADALAEVIPSVLATPPKGVGGFDTAPFEAIVCHGIAGVPKAYRAAHPLAVPAPTDPRIDRPAAGAAYPRLRTNRPPTTPDGLGRLDPRRGFVQVCAVDRVPSPDPFDLRPGRAVLMVEDGSGRFGEAVTEDFRIMTRLPGSLQDSWIPLYSKTIRHYLEAMAAALNLAAAQRHALALRALAVIEGVAGPPPSPHRLLCDAPRYSIRLEVQTLEGLPRRLLVHRKNAAPLDPGACAVLPGPPGLPAWIVAAGPAAHAAHCSACAPAAGAQGDAAGRVVRILAEAGVVTPVGRLRPLRPAP